MKLAKEVDADIVLATDPDADRLGVYAKDTKTGEYVSFTGNMSGMLIAEYILREKKANGTLPANGALVETIVTTDMAKAIAKAYGVKLIEVLTGFKYIGEQIKFFEQQNSYEYVFGLEESYGCLAGTYARDKDACVAVMMLCEVAAWCKSNGITLWDAMVSLYEIYGYYKEGLETMTLKGMDGAEKIQSMMNEMRNNPPKKIGAWDVLALRDYKKDTRTDMTSGEVTPTGLPESKDVCSCSLRIGNRCIALIQVVLIYFGSIRSLNGNCCALLLIRSPGNIIIRYRTLALGQIQLQLQCCLLYTSPSPRD